MKISIIMPVYNAASYLERAMKSLIQISIKEVEFICVDDGSTDRSLAILNEYASKDERVIAIGQEHEGVSAARNRGLTAAEGTYVMFMDADDCFVLDTINHIRDFLDDTTDIFLFPYIEYKDGRKTLRSLPTVSNCRSIEALRCAAVESKEINSVWAKVFRRSIIVENQICFPLGIKMGEDLIFNLSYLHYTKRFLYCNKPLYQYNIHEGSANTTFENSRFRDLYMVYKAMCKAAGYAKASTVFIDDFLFYIVIGLKYTDRKNMIELLCRQDIIRATAKAAKHADAKNWYKSVFVLLLQKGRMRTVVDIYFVRFLIVDFLRKMKIVG